MSKLENFNPELLELIEYDEEVLFNDLNKFDCNNKYLNEYLYRARDTGYKRGKTWIWVYFGTNDIVGYFTISASAISLNEYCLDEDAITVLEELEDLCKNLNRKNMLVKKAGAIGLDCFAINNCFKGKNIPNVEDLEQKFSTALLEIALESIKEAREILDTDWVVLYSTLEGRSLYLNAGFEFLNFSDKLQYCDSHNLEKPYETDEEKEKSNKFKLIVNNNDMQCIPMILRISE
ncbi:Uncharacterised protein [[Clostridium] sordellii]|uniref:hypothetical protein n=1 Tax=Paraclostridium sordellii TaxID=1505 RepID=UPI0005E809C5|nr:hypothetical protein [Paeniclostridium sordellii]CEQ29997.1 Uncharacterised protein [[Clostridium] sordellii] [Paeniclostridium sordellii]